MLYISLLLLFFILFSSLLSFHFWNFCSVAAFLWSMWEFLWSQMVFSLSLSLTLCIHCLMSNYYIVCPYSQALCEWLRSHAMLPPLFCLMHSRFFRVANFFIRFEVKFTDIPHLVDQRRIYFSELGIPVFFLTDIQIADYQVYYFWVFIEFHHSLKFNTRIFASTFVLLIFFWNN